MTLTIEIERKQEKTFLSFLKTLPYIKVVLPDHTKEEWNRLSEESLKDIWETPENEVWDKIFVEQNG